MEQTSATRWFFPEKNTTKALAKHSTKSQSLLALNALSLYFNACFLKTRGGRPWARRVLALGLGIGSSGLLPVSLTSLSCDLFMIAWLV